MSADPRTSSTGSAAVPRLARGMRDILPASARRRAYVIEKLHHVYELFGYEPLDTPALELIETLTGKYGPDADRLIFGAGLNDARDLGLRYDLTVPLARVAATYDDLPKPFRRYQIAPLWRGERPQRGRYREFLQADTDIVGSHSMLADAEIIQLTIVALRSLGFERSNTKINNRKLLRGIGRYAGVAEDILPGLYRAIDKLDKVGRRGVRLELRAVGLPADLLNRQRQAVERWVTGKADRTKLERDLRKAITSAEPPGVAERALPAFLDALEAESRDPESGNAGAAAIEEARQRAMSSSIDALRSEFPADALIPDDVTDRLLGLLAATGSAADHELGETSDNGAHSNSGSGGARALLESLAGQLADAESRAGIDELLEVIDALDAAGTPAERYSVDPAMVRGLEYYTGTIFETIVPGVPIGSITGGGRYDNLIGMFGRDVPAVGTSLGIDRMVDAMDTLGLFPPEIEAPAARILIARFSPETADTKREAIALASQLRAEGLAVELYLDDDPLGEQLRYALKKGHSFFAIVGPDELAGDAVALRDLSAGSQTSVSRADVASRARALLEGSA